MHTAPIPPALAYWLKFEVQRDENELRLWNERRSHSRGVCWSAMGAGEKPVMRSDEERLAAARSAYQRSQDRAA